MHISQTHVSEDILSSQTRPMAHSSKHNNPAHQQPLITSINKPDEKAFLRIYEQNNKLKSEKLLLTQRLDQMRRKEEEITRMNRTYAEQQIKQLAGSRKLDAQISVNHASHKKVSSRAGFSHAKPATSHKVEHLLEIIDHYKAKCQTAQEELINLRRQKAMLENDLAMRSSHKTREDKMHEGDDGSHHKIREELQLGERLKKSIRELQMEREKNKFYEMSMKSLEGKLKILELKVQDFDQLKLENRNLQEKILRMTQMPSFSSTIDRVDEERRIKELQSKYKAANDKLNSSKTDAIKRDAENKILLNELITKTSQLDLMEKELEMIKQRTVDNPIIDKLNSQPDLLRRVMAEIEKEKLNKGKPDQLGMREKYERVILEKEELAKEIISLRGKIKAVEETFREKEKLNKLEKQEMIASLNQVGTSKTSSNAVTTSKLGIAYDGDISMFSETQFKVENGVNYFDLFVGELHLLESMLGALSGLKNTAIPLILVTVDFYNHPTQHSKLTQGSSCNLQSQFIFKVNEDEFFLRFLQKGTFSIDVWAAEGGKNSHVGRCQIELKSLITKAKPKIASIIQTSTPVYLNGKVMGSINIVMRMRLPIYEQLQKIESTSLHPSTQQTITKRKLIVQVSEGMGFPDKANTFVYYPFRLEDYYTKTFKGANPQWQHFNLIEINYDNDAKNYLRKTALPFTVFDDNALMGAEIDSDVLGSGSINLLALLQGKQIRERLEIRKGNAKKGWIEVKIGWYEPENSKKQSIKSKQEMEKEEKDTQEYVHLTIREYMKESGVDGERIYRQIDNNKTGLISFDEFQSWLRKISQYKFSHQVVAGYYKSFAQPLNITSFLNHLSSPALIPMTSSKSNQPPTPSIKNEMGMINKFLKSNSIKIKKQSLTEFLRGKELVNIVCEIDKDGNGYISKKELLAYFEQHDIEAEIEDQNIKLYDFLKKYKDLDK